MSSSFGNQFKVQVFGQSHGEKIGVVLDGVPAGIKLDMDEINAMIDRRKGGKNAYSTARSESDIPHIVSGVVNNVTCGGAICALFDNANTRSGDYKKSEDLLRPSHADFTAWVKYDGFQDRSGGGFFSGRLTLPQVFAGAVCKQILRAHGIEIFGHVAQIGDIKDDLFHPVSVKPVSFHTQFPVLNEDKGKEMVAFMEQVAREGDSVGGIIECAVTGMPIGIGEPLFDNLESHISRCVFTVPAVKGIEFGMGFDGVIKKGSEVNDPYAIRDGKVVTTTNNSGGIAGGISNGMPIIFRVAMKPTPSIYKEQKTVDYKTKEETILQINGRHDPCIVPRALPCIEAAAAMAIYDLFLISKCTKPGL